MIEIFTDGSALAKKGHVDYQKGGCAAIFYSNGEEIKRFSRGFYPTKIGRMELMAVLLALKLLSKGQEAIIFSDSMYAVNCFNKKWLEGWEMQNWPDRIKNKDLLKDILEEYRKFRKGNIRLKHVKGHIGIEGNELADKLSNYKTHDFYYDDSIWL